MKLNPQNNLPLQENETLKRYLVSEQSLYGGFQLVYEFPNGYGASVVSHEFSYGGREGLVEIAVLDDQGHITYDTSVTSDVIGYLDWNEAEGILEQIKNL
jgi:hypothetical protein